MKRLLCAALASAALVSGCALSGAGILNGVQTAGMNPGASPSPGSTAANKTNAQKPVDKVTVSQNDTVVLVKKTTKVQATVSYLDGSKDGDIQWASKDATIVQVNPTTGEISGVSPGTATIYARATSDPDNKFAVINVTVKEGVVEDLAAAITPKTSTIAVGDTVQLNAAITNSSTQTTPNGSWSSSNSQKAFVNDSGLVTGRAAGKVTITFTSDQNATVHGTATVTVTDDSGSSDSGATN